MTIGDQPAFPSKESPFIPGMTYRQWLVGQIAPSMNDEHWGQNHEDQVAEWIINRADAIIAKMDGEGK